MFLIKIFALGLCFYEALGADENTDCRALEPTVNVSVQRLSDQVRAIRRCHLLDDATLERLRLETDHNNHVRRDGGMCFELPPWQHLPVELDTHLLSVKDKFGNATHLRRQIGSSQLALVNSQLSRYMDTVLAPFLDTYLRNIQSSYQQMTSKILRRIKDDINNAVQKKNQIYKELMDLAQELNVPAMCDEERRQARVLASRHVAQVYGCTEEARASIAKMGKYAEEMITITKNHMQRSLEEATKTLTVKIHRSRNSQEVEVTDCIRELSKSAVKLGYELDLSLTNARRHNEQSLEKLTACVNKAKKSTDDDVTDLKDLLYQCVYA